MLNRIKTLALTACFALLLMFGVHLYRGEIGDSSTSKFVSPTQEDQMIRRRIEMALQSCFTAPQVITVLKANNFRDIDDYSFKEERTISAVRLPEHSQGKSDDEIAPRAIGVTVQFVDGKRFSPVVRLGVGTE